jgi:hypothetical protein
MAPTVLVNTRVPTNALGSMVDDRVDPPQDSFPTIVRGASLPPIGVENDTPGEEGQRDLTQPPTELPDSGRKGRKTHTQPEMASSNRPTRIRRSPDRLIESIGFPNAGASAGASPALERPNIPPNYQAAIQDPVYSMEWKAAIQDELQKLVSMGAFKVTGLPKGRRRVGCRWVFEVKYTPNGLIDRFKARLVAKGFSQTHGSDYTDTFSPTIKMDSLRALLAIAAANNWPIEQMDVISAYLAGVLDEDIYMTPPEGLGLPEDFTVQVIKALYRLKQSGRIWYKRIRDLLKSLGLERTDSD